MDSRIVSASKMQSVIGQAGPQSVRAGTHERTVPGVKKAHRRCLDCGMEAFLHVLENTNCGSFVRNKK